MSQTETFVCDECGKSVISGELPPAWRRLSLESIDADLRGDYTADICSPQCAAGWACKAFERDTP